MALLRRLTIMVSNCLSMFLFCQRYYPMEEETNEIFNRYPLFENSPLDSPSGVTHGE